MLSYSSPRQPHFHLCSRVVRTMNHQARLLHKELQPGIQILTGRCSHPASPRIVRGPPTGSEESSSPAPVASAYARPVVQHRNDARVLGDLRPNVDRNCARYLLQRMLDAVLHQRLDRQLGNFSSIRLSSQAYATCIRLPNRAFCSDSSSRYAAAPLWPVRYPCR